MAISSDAMMDAAYAWVIKSRLESAHNNSIWNLRYNWTSWCRSVLRCSGKTHFNETHLLEPWLPHYQCTVKIFDKEEDNEKIKILADNALPGAYAFREYFHYGLGDNYGAGDNKLHIIY